MFCYIPIRVQVESNGAATRVIVAVRKTEMGTTSIVGAATILIGLYLSQRVVADETQYILLK